MPARFSQPVADVVMTIAMMLIVTVMGRSSAGLGWERATFGAGAVGLAFGFLILWHIGHKRDASDRWRLVLCWIILVVTLAAAIFSPP